FGLLVGIAGGLIRIWCFRTMGRAFTFNVTKSSPKLVTSGPYSLVRHPAYLGATLLCIGIAAYHVSPGSWLRESTALNYLAGKAFLGFFIFITSGVMNVCHILRTEEEDRLMKSMFGKEWEAWSRVVRYKVFPGLY
ncbi:hypothetical protein L218DRAFT_879205, partial [Marasmius fiardii PR-910]